MVRKPGLGTLLLLAILLLAYAPLFSQISTSGGTSGELNESAVLGSLVLDGMPETVPLSRNLNGYGIVPVSRR